MRGKKLRTEKKETEGGVGGRSVFLENKMKRKWLFYTQVSNCGRVPVATAYECKPVLGRNRKVNSSVVVDHLKQPLSGSLGVWCAQLT